MLGFSNKPAAKPTVTADRLRELLSYDPESGVWVRLKSTGKAKVGSTAGSIEPRGYRRIRIDGKPYLSSRLAHLFMKGEWPTHEMDHIDCNPSNDSWLNLRPATRLQNNANRKLSNKSGFQGASRSSTNRYKAEMKLNGKRIYLGSFVTAEEAHASYVTASKEIYGAFSRAA
jgi:hypothetical protein